MTLFYTPMLNRDGGGPALRSSGPANDTLNTRGNLGDGLQAYLHLARPG